MSDDVVQFESIELHRVRGIERAQAFALSGFSSGINVIHGPNGSGKSTTARALHELLWPGKTNLFRPSITGEFRTGSGQWRVDIDAGHPLVTRDGKTGTTPEFGPAENRHRYYISLHELISDDDADFAKAIADASQGGYDLEAAAQSLGFRERPPSRKSLRDRLQARQHDVGVARHRQQEIGTVAAQLQELRNQRGQAIAAEQEVALLRCAQEYHEAAEQCRQLQMQLAALPQGISKLRGDERSRIDDLSTQRQNMEQQQSDEQERRRTAQATLQETALPDDGVESQVLQSLNAWQRRLANLEADIQRYRNELRENEGEADRAERRLGAQFTKEQLAAVDSLEVGELNDFARRVDQVRGEECALRERHKNIPEAAPKEIQQLSTEHIRDGLKALSQWLSAPKPAETTKRSISWPLVTAALCIVVLGIVLSVTANLLWVATLLVALAILAADWWTRKHRIDQPAANARQIHRQSYEVTGLSEPHGWDDAKVLQHLDHLLDVSLQRKQEDERIRQAKQLNNDLADHKQRRRDLEKRREQLVERLGLELKIDEQWMVVLVDNIAAWQLATGKVAGAQQALEGLHQKRSDLLTKIDASLKPYGYDSVGDAETAAEAIDALKERQNRYTEAARDLQDACGRLQRTIEPGLEELAQQYDRLLSDLGIEAGQEYLVDQWLDQHPEYLRISGRLTATETIRNDRQQKLAARNDLIDLDLAQLEQQIEDQTSIASQRDALSENIAAIERDIKAAREGFELSAALEARDAAEGDLQDALEENCNKVIGDMLTKIIREEAVQRSRPDVFRLANSLLVKFTCGTLQLHVDDAGHEPRFLASSSNAGGIARSVDKLSSGERVQLLMAVRMAFMQYDERCRLPLLLDETLGTSDDDRVSVIIDNVTEIAREGRQVFYFTAQRDEVGKLLAKANQRNVPIKVFDLAEVRQLKSAESTPLQITTVPVAQRPAPNGIDYEAYGKMLNVPGLDPFSNLPGTVHLWHVLTDPEQLYGLLCKNINTWGQLELLIDHGGAGLVDVSDGGFDRAAASAKAIKAAADAWRVGRGREVDRAALLESECVSDSFMDDLVALAEANGGNAQGIIDALERGDVSRWRKKSTEALESYFEENGYLPDIAPVQVNEIRIRVMASVAEELTTNQIDETTIERILGSLPLDSFADSTIS